MRSESGEDLISGNPEMSNETGNTKQRQEEQEESGMVLEIRPDFPAEWSIQAACVPDLLIDLSCNNC